MQKTAIIIPCYNEEKRLACQKILVFSQINKSVYFIMVNDGSTDNTAVLIKNLQDQSNSKIFSLHLEQNNGKAEAVRQGFIKAFSLEFQIIGYWDADLAAPLYEIINLYNYMEQSQAEMAFGSRIRLLGRKIERKQTRHYLGRLFATIVSFILKTNIYDSQCGAKLFRNTSELRAIFKTPFSVNWVFDVEILARYLLIRKISQHSPLELSAVEYPLQEWQDVSDSKVTIFDFIKSGFELISLLFFIYRPGWKNRAKKLLANNK